MNPTLRREIGPENIMSFISVDVNRVFQIFSEGNYGFSVVILVFPFTVMLWQLLGYSGLVGMALLLFLFIINILIFKNGVIPLKVKILPTQFYSYILTKSNSSKDIVMVTFTSPLLN